MSLPPPIHPHSFYIRTFGCQMNLHDSEHISGTLSAAGYIRADLLEDADIVVFNTCCVRQSAEDRVWGNVAALAGADGKQQLVALTGCMAQKHRSDILSRAPNVGLVFGIESLEDLPQLIETSLTGRVSEVRDPFTSRVDETPSERQVGTQAWVPVSHGCDNRCSYCVVPAVRGAYRSRREEDVVSDAVQLSEQGVVEVVLLGQNVNAYGQDIGSDFASLLRGICSVPGIERVKFETSHPRDMTVELLKTMADEPKVCEYLHLPVQSGSDAVLTAMRRGYTRDDYLELVDNARNIVPGLVLTTDIIVGFPGETDDDFEDTMRLVREVRFDAAYMFLYSCREGTPASEMAGEVSDSLKHERFSELSKEQERITVSSLEKVLGKRVEVVVTGKAKRGGMTLARTRGNRVVLLKGKPAAEGVFEVLVEAAGKHSLRGSEVKSGSRKSP